MSRRHHWGGGRGWAPGRRVAALLALGAGLAACGPDLDLDLRYTGDVPLPLAAFCQAQVQGVGTLDVETDYLPHVVTCENGGASFESLKAQAVAARSYLYYKLSLYGSIRDGQNDQVYSCAAQPGPNQLRAVQETAGQYLHYGSSLLCAFYVAGAHQSPPACQGNTSDSTNTERYVTYNWGNSGDDVEQSTLGWVSPSNHANRGCMSQWGSRCLSDDGWGYQDILRFYYGMDIGLATATGPCVVPPEPPNQPPLGFLDTAGCAQIGGWAQDPDEPDAPIDVHLYLDGAAGDAAATALALSADVARDDLCAAIGSCAHGFALATPRGLMDGEEHSVYAYGIDSAGGDNALLGNAPRTLRCDPPALSLAPDAGVRRWIVSPTSFADWQFSMLFDVAHVDDALLGGYAQGPDLSPWPVLVRGDDGAPEVWLLDSGVRRHVPSPEAMAAWRFDPAQVGEVSAAEITTLPEGAPLPAAPFLLKGSGPEIYLLDVVDCLGASPAQDAGADPDGAGADGDAADEDASWVDDVQDKDGIGGQAATQEPTAAESLEVGAGLACRATSRTGGPWAPLALLLLAARRRRPSWMVNRR